MNQKVFLAQWDHFRQVVGIGMRLVDALPENQLDSRPIAKMRSPKELVVHQYGMTLRSVMEGTVAGEIKEIDEKAAVAQIRTKADLVRYCRDCWAAADRAARLLTDEKFHASIKTPWGMDLPGVAAVGVTFEEFMHHRGQLFVYLRALGCDVPMMWDFEHNAAEFRPTAAAQA